MIARITTNQITWQAFRLMNEIGDRHVPKRFLAERFEVDKELLYQNLGRLERQLRSIESASLLAPFSRRDRSASLEQIIQDWKENKRMLAWQLSGEGISYDVASMYVEELELSVRSYNILKRAGITTIGDLLNKSEDELRRCGMGNKSFLELKELLTTTDSKLGEIFNSRLKNLVSE